MSLIAMFANPFVAGQSALAADAGAQTGDTVVLHYTGSTASGEVFESTRDGGPRGITIGTNSVLPALEQQLIGIQAGERRTIHIPSDQAFGPYRDEPGMKTRLMRAALSHRLDPKVGMRLNAAVFADEKALEPTHVPVTVVEITDEYLVIDANHPLAGKDIVFEVQAVEVIPRKH
jgi:peptidylprolyl isomerase